MNLPNPINAFPIRRILLIACAVLLGATVVLGGLLKASYEARGRLTGQVEALSRQVAEKDKEIKLYAKSEKLTDNLQAQGNKQKQEIRDGTVDTLLDLCTPDSPVEVKNEKTQYAPRNAPLSPKSDRVLRERFREIQSKIAP